MALVSLNRTFCAMTEITLCLFAGKSERCEHECVRASVWGKQARLARLAVLKKPLT